MGRAAFAFRYMYLLLGLVLLLRDLKKDVIAKNSLNNLEINLTCNSHRKDLCRSNL